MMSTSRTSELEAVNTILSAVGEPPINSLDEQKNADAAIARNILNEVSREVQTHGWHFNTQQKVKLSPSTDSHIVLDDSVVRVDIENIAGGTYNSTDITQRGNKLFNRTDNTYVFSNDVEATVIYLLGWGELPEPARRFVTVRAARIFQDRMVGSQAHHAFSREDESRARALLKEFEGETADHSIFDNYDVYRIVNRPDVTRGRNS
tara:strand:- start:3344 stop:3961 length:618 start_codon:yes stop_codon:yes gene_type:complete